MDEPKTGLWDFLAQYNTQCLGAISKSMSLMGWPGALARSNVKIEFRFKYGDDPKRNFPSYNNKQKQSRSKCLKMKLGQHFKKS